MNLGQLSLLRLVVDTGSFTAAARQAGISQPAVSQAMASLARQVGEPLFVRSGRQARPTVRALSLARAAVPMDEARAQAVEAVHAAQRGDAGRRRQVLRVGLAPAAGLVYGPTMVEAVHAARPRPLLSISTGPAPGMLAQLLRGELDLVIAPRPRGLQDPRLRHQVMYTSHPTIYAREGNPLARATTLRAIARAEWAVAGSAGTPGNVVEEAFRVRRWRPPRIAVQCADYAMLLKIVSASDLLGVVSHPGLVPAPHRQGLVPVRVTEGLPHYEVCLFWQDEALHPWPAGMGRVLAALGAGESARP
ncbi:LysR family transcriptional regulator [Ramlibacter sp. MAHUQ-53]|uniref:LysR family transcriptional regulator n=1 Tax=unclassified Ramlibacter TaxID=2617605 RepID=UPI003626097D